MVRKFLMLASLVGFLLAVSTQAHPPYQNSQSDQQAPKVHSVTGKVTQVETGGKAFSMDISQGNDKRPMRFVLDKGHDGARPRGRRNNRKRGLSVRRKWSARCSSVSEQSAQPQ